MSLTQSQLDDKLIGKSVSTPDGAGKVTGFAASGRYISVDLSNGQKRQFDPNEIALAEKEKKA